MANFIKELCEWMETNSVSGTTPLIIGENLLAGWRPQEALDTCVLVGESAGGKPDFYLPDAVEKAVQVLTRAETYHTAGDLAQEVHDLLHGLSAVDLTSFLINTIDSQNVPQYIGEDDHPRYEFSENFIMRYQDLPA